MSDTQHPGEWSPEQATAWLAALSLESRPSASRLTGAELMDATEEQLQAKLGVTADEACRIRTELSSLRCQAGAAGDAAGPDAGSGGGSGSGGVDLQSYQQLQQIISDLQGLQIQAQAFHLQRRQRALDAQLASMAGLLEESRAAVARAQAAADKFRGETGCFPGQLPDMLLGKKDANIAKSQEALQAANEQLAQRSAQHEALHAAQEETSARLAVWLSKEAALEAAQAAVAKLEAHLMASASPEDAERRAEVFDALCAMDGQADGGSEEGSEEGSADAAAAAAAAGEGADAGAGTAEAAPRRLRWHFPLLRLVASALPLPRSKSSMERGGSAAVPNIGRGSAGRLTRLSTAQLGRAAAGQGLEVEVEVEGSRDVDVEVEGTRLGVETADVLERAPTLETRLTFDGSGLRRLADVLGRPVQPDDKDQYGRMFRGRMLRIAADKMARAADSRRRAREDAAARVAAGIRSHSGKKLGVPAELAHLFPKDACAFNPGNPLHCPPSTFLWLYPSRFLGKLQRLQTGPVLQAFHRFGPFDCDPDNPRRLVPRAPEGPPLILLTGMGSTMIAWGVPLLRALATSHEVIIMEYRGAGLSKDLGSEPWNYYLQAEAVLLLADALGIQRFNWLGWSSGGNTGLVLAALHGERLGRMASLAGMAGGPNTIVPPAYCMLDPERSLSLGQTMALIFPPDDAKEFHATCASYIKDVFSMPGAITDQEVGPQAAREQWAADQEFIHRDGRVWDALPAVTTPCLIMNGTRDILVPHENAVRIAGRIPGARLHTFEGWAHAFKDAGRLAEVVTEFMCAE